MKTFFGRVLAVLVGLGIFIVGIFFVFSIIVSLLGDTEPTVADDSILVLDFEDPIIESDMENEVSLLSLGDLSNTRFLSILKAIENAKSDDKIKGISIEFTNPLVEELEQVRSIRQAIIDFKTSGKFVYAYTNQVTQNGYYLASVADSIFHHPMGNLELIGLSSEVMFFKEFGDKYGIEFEVIRHGDYKAAVEPFFRNSLSEENREQLTELVTDLWGTMNTDIGKSRNLTVDQINTFADSLSGFSATQAEENKIVDVLWQESDYLEFLKEELALSEREDLSRVNIIEYTESLPTTYDKNEIAVLYASGNIMPGDGYSGIQAETYKDAIRDIADDDDIKALVLRVNSGGGSAVASDEILYELKLLKLDKPVIVSFGNVAASGGYYIAMEGDKIFAQPNTITGSIGVLGMVPNAKKLLNDNGITTDFVRTNANSNYYSPFNGLTPYAKKKLERTVEDTYDRFITLVAKGRNMDKSKVDALGGGRIYSGKRALELGLVDNLGGLEDAIAYAAELTELEDYSIDNYPKKPTELEILIEDLNLAASIKQDIIKSTGANAPYVLEYIEALTNNTGVQMWMPFHLNIK